MRSLSFKSPIMGVAPEAWMPSAYSFLRTKPVTWFPSETSKPIIFQPMKPGPTMKTFFPMVIASDNSVTWYMLFCLP